MNQKPNLGPQTWEVSTLNTELYSKTRKWFLIRWRIILNKHPTAFTHMCSGLWHFYVCHLCWGKKWEKWARSSKWSQDHQNGAKIMEVLTPKCLLCSTLASGSHKREVDWRYHTHFLSVEHILPSLTASPWGLRSSSVPFWNFHHDRNSYKFIPSPLRNTRTPTHLFRSLH